MSSLPSLSRHQVATPTERLSEPRRLQRLVVGGDGIAVSEFLASEPKISVESYPTAIERRPISKM